MTKDEKLKWAFDRPQQIIVIETDGEILDLTEDWLHVYDAVSRANKEKCEPVIESIYWDGRFQDLEVDGCPECKTYIQPKWNYCPICGQRVGE